MIKFIANIIVLGVVINYAMANITIKDNKYNIEKLLDIDNPMYMTLFNDKLFISSENGIHVVEMVNNRLSEKITLNYLYKIENNNSPRSVAIYNNILYVGQNNGIVIYYDLTNKSSSIPRKIININSDNLYIKAIPNKNSLIISNNNNIYIYDNNKMKYITQGGIFTYDHLNDQTIYIKNKINDNCTLFNFFAESLNPLYDMRSSPLGCGINPTGITTSTSLFPINGILSHKYIIISVYDMKQLLIVNLKPGSDEIYIFAQGYNNTTPFDVLSLADGSILISDYSSGSIYRIYRKHYLYVIFIIIPILFGVFIIFFVVFIRCLDRSRIQFYQQL